MKLESEGPTCGPGPMGPIPRGPLILCIGPKLGWPVERGQELLFSIFIHLLNIICFFFGAQRSVNTVKHLVALWGPCWAAWDEDQGRHLVATGGKT